MNSLQCGGLGPLGLLRHGKKKEYVTRDFRYATLRAGTGLPVCVRRKCKEKVKFAVEGPEGLGVQLYCFYNLGAI
jgi:hypothetical protein